ncbi:hypothetical protein [Brachybacterium sp. YJGR34]|uniref:hypothetical protein n=1 Tax=Brachybacterium sp. YJGR34 TaxID=2059911 RepID=UPI000E0C8DC7|nr:hypothetical protein [Brachybacterium sp. YJGR34]
MLSIIFFGVGNLTVSKRTALGEVFDAHPVLRPARIGDDPPRTIVGDSIVSHLAAPKLPLWLIGAPNRQEEEATWFIDLSPEWQAVEGPGGAKQVVRATSRLALFVGPERARAAGGPDGLAGFFAELGDALGASYGCIFPEGFYDKLDAWYPDVQCRPDPREGLGSVYWLQYFGPAFADRYPGLRDLPLTMTTARGATVYRATDRPEHTLKPDGGPLEGDWREPLVSVLGEKPFHFDSSENAALPSDEEHASHDPNSESAPVDLLERLDREARERDERRAREYTRAHDRRLQLERRRVPPAEVDTSQEWSTNFDSDQIQRFWKALRSCLAPDITGPYAGALSREMANAPRESTGKVLLGSAHGAFVLSWWAEDEESLTVAVHGPRAVIRCFERAVD